VCAFFVGCLNLVAKGKVKFSGQTESDTNQLQRQTSNHAKRVRCPECKTICSAPLGHTRFKCPKCKSVLEVQTKNKQEVVSPKDKQWKCAACCYTNPGHHQMCQMCKGKSKGTDVGEKPLKKKPSLGIDVKATSGGVVVVGVIDGFPGQKAGVQVGDILNTVNGVEVTTAQQFFVQYSKVAEDKNICFAAHRNGVEVPFIVKAMWFNPDVNKQETKKQDDDTNTVTITGSTPKPAAAPQPSATASAPAPAPAPDKKAAEEEVADILNLEELFFTKSKDPEPAEDLFPFGDEHGQEHDFTEEPAPKPDDVFENWMKGLM